MIKVNKKNCENCKFRTHYRHVGDPTKLKLAKCSIWSPKLELHGHEGWVPSNICCQYHTPNKGVKND